MQPTHTTVTDDVTTPARTLRDAARYLQLHGWVQGCYYDTAATVFTPAACMVGAIGVVCYGGPVEAPALNFADPGWPDFEDTVTALNAYLAAAHVAHAYEFNDAKGRTAADVIATLRVAADHLDGREPVAVHFTYPHGLGTLYDCPGCQAVCFCADGFVCVRCATVAGSCAESVVDKGGAA